jgi:hypothetical protein
MKDLLNSVNQMADGAMPDILDNLLKLDGTYVIKNINGLVLDVAGGSKNDNAAIITFKFNRGDNQRFKIEQQQDSTYKITAVHSDKVLTITEKNKVVQSTWNGTHDQKWKIIDNKGNSLKFINVKNGMVLDIPGNSSAEKTELWTYPDNETKAQGFILERW